jgi:hypothetical protein
MTAMDPCVQEKRISNIEIQVNKVKDTLEGKDGLMSLVTKQIIITREQSKNIEILSKNVEKLILKDVATDKEKEVILRVSKENDQYRNEKKRYQRWLMTSLLTIAGLFLTIMGLIIKYNPAN